MNVDTNPQRISTICKAIIVSLPRQLRDRIYIYVVRAAREKITICDGKLPHYLRSHCNITQSHHSFWKSTALDGYVNPRRVGHQMARELAEAYYSTNTFYFDYHELYLIQKFLTVDRFGCDILPAHFIRSIEIVLHENYSCGCNTNALNLRNPVPIAKQSAVDTIQSCLSQLSRLRVIPIKLNVIIYREQRQFPGETNQEILLDILRPVLVDLNNKGNEVSLEFHTSLGREWKMEGSELMPIREGYDRDIYRTPALGIKGTDTD